MCEWSDKLKLGKSSAFVKKKLRVLPLTGAQFEADFFLDPESWNKRQALWIGLVIEREFGALLAMDTVWLPPPTVNDLANLLAHAMFRPLTEGDQQRPGKIFLRDRAQWQELLPHLGQLGIEVAFRDNLARFDETAIDWVQQRKMSQQSQEEIKVILRKPFPERKQIRYTETVDLTVLTNMMAKGAYGRGDE